MSVHVLRSASAGWKAGGPGQGPSVAPKPEHNRGVAETVRYRPGEVLRWLKIGAERETKGAVDRARSVFRQTGLDQKSVAENIKTAAGAVVDFGKGKIADQAHARLEGTEYVLSDDRFDVVEGAAIRTIPYSEVAGVKMEDERGVVVLSKGQLSIKPVAHLLAGRARVPIGWNRNGSEVPFDLLLEEIAARAGVEVE